jgi:ABC-type transport system substrate-binding protein
MRSARTSGLIARASIGKSASDWPSGWPAGSSPHRSRVVEAATVLPRTTTSPEKRVQTDANAAGAWRLKSLQRRKNEEATAKARECRGRLQVVDQTAANRLWSKIDREIVDQAPWLPLHTYRQVNFVAKRVGNFQYNPQFGLLLDQLWVR